MIVQVAIPSPLYSLFDYELETERLETPIGYRVRVSFGRQNLVGIVIGVANESIHKKLKKADLLDSLPIMTEDLLKLGQWIADYYHAPIGLVFKMMLPQKLRKDEAYERTRETYLGLSDNFQTWIKDNPTKKARTFLIEQLAEHLPIKRSEFSQKFSNFKTHEKALMADKVVLHVEQYADRLDLSSHNFPTLPYALNDEQKHAVQAINLNKFSVSLLEGVTGSGKTAVYLELAKRVLQEGQQVLILVPEIGLTPQFIERVKNILSVPFVVVHSEVNETEKIRAWEAAKYHTVSLVIGTRSALFTPFDHLGMIIIDEEHDGSYRQRDTVRYSAHDAAIQRAYFLNIPIVLGSATPILETIHNVEKGRYQLLSLSERAKGKIPDWQVVDMNETMSMDGLSVELLNEIEVTLQRQEQIIIYINRRGYSPVLMCEGCGWVPECKSCEYRLTVYRKTNSLRCHHCNHIEALPRKCPSCNQALLKMLGHGTERIEKALQDAFPKANVIRFDRDQLKSKTAFASAVDQVIEGEADIIIGTQMIAKGHDFAKVTLVGIVDIDGILYSSDFRAEEKLAQTLMQVSGRSGRDVSHGKVIIQTHFPEHALFNDLPKQGYAQFSRNLLEQRQHFEFPPYEYQALFQVEGQNERETLQAFEQLMQNVDCRNYPVGITPIYPNALSKRQNFYRFYIVLQSKSRKDLHKAVHYLMTSATTILPSKIRHFCEIDPWDFD